MTTANDPTPIIVYADGDVEDPDGMLDAFDFATLRDEYWAELLS